ESLTRRGIVEHIAEERGLRGLGDEVQQPLGGRFEAFEKECVHRRIPRDQLRGMQIPALVEGVGERVADILVMQSPRAMDGCAILRSMLRREREPCTAMDRYGQYVCRAIR